MHGGKARGPVTPEGLLRSQTSQLVHGFYTVEQKQRRRIDRQGIRDLISRMRQAVSALRSKPEFPG